MKNITEKARNLRKNMTSQERKIWSFLRKRSVNNMKFRRQYPIGSYIVDFICHEKMLIIEVDGEQHYLNENLDYEKIIDKATYAEPSNRCEGLCYVIISGEIACVDAVYTGAGTGRAIRRN